jgi:mannose-6-phosphate isomerase-like protein (cupin superfamily)
MNIKNDIRPWGSFRQFTENESTTIKLINITAGQRLSLQYHNNRNEFWVILSGNPIITVGEETVQAKAGDEFFIPEKANHRIEGSGNDAQILEIAFGDFDENDIVRLDDNYGRVS